MQYEISPLAGIARFERFEVLLRKIDASALVDVDAIGTTRISASTTAAELLDVLRQSGCPIDASHLKQLPSHCCGGCGG